MRTPGICFAAFCVTTLLMATCVCGQPPKPEPTFFAPRFTKSEKLFPDPRAEYGEFTLAGPQGKEWKPSPKRIVKVAYDLSAKQLYGLGGSHVYQFDLTKGSAVELNIPAELPRFSSVNGITYDSKRERIVVVSFGGEWHLYSFTPKDKKWSLICDMEDRDLVTLTYDPHTDQLYGVYNIFGKGRTVLGVFDAAGRLVKNLEITEPSLRKRVGEPIFHVSSTVVGDELALITPDRIYAMHLMTEEIRLTWTRE